MARKHEIAIASETGAFEKGIKSGVVKPLEQAEDALEKLGDVNVGREIDRDLEAAQRATKSLKDETKDAADQIEKAFRDSYKKSKNESEESTDKMKAGFREAADEAQQSGREAAASFSGGFEDVADFVQETLANALSGFGPVGLAAGVALAGLLGFVMGQAEMAQEKLNAARERASELASTLYENNGTIPMADRISEMFDMLAEESGSGNMLTGLVDQWVDFGSTLDSVRKTAKLTGSGMGDMIDALTGGDLEQSERMLEAVNEKLEELEGNVGTSWAWDPNLIALREARDEIEKTVEANKLAAEISAEVSSSASAAAAQRAEAEEEAAARIKSATESVTAEQLNGYDRMRDAAYEKATADDQAFDVGRWLDYVEQTRGAADSYRANLQTMQLTPGEWENLLGLPEEARSAIAASYASSGEEGKARIRQALGDGGAGDAGSEATVSFQENFQPEADVTVTADTSKAEEKLVAVAKKREAEIAVKLTGMAEARKDLDDLAKRRDATIRAVVDSYQWDRYVPATKTGVVRTRIQYTDQ